MASRPCVSEIPADLEIRYEPRRPVDDPTLGIGVDVDDGPVPPNRLVTVGDSLTHGFMSAAIFRTDISWPAMVAHELGIGPYFRYPTYENPTGPGGLPLDLERLARAFERRFGHRLDWYEVVRAGLWLRSYLERIEDHWERGPGSARPPAGPPPFHNMAVYGWDLLDALLLDADRVQARLDRRRPDDDLVPGEVEGGNDLAARVVLERARAAAGAARTTLRAAAALGEEGAAGGPGIETLVVMLGANNALGAAVDLRLCWTTAEYGGLTPEERLVAKGGFTVWHPRHFAEEWALLAAEVRRVRARHVVVATVPAVTIAPIARGLHGKVRPGSRYFHYYSRPWMTEDAFDPRQDPHITADQARAVDSAIDAYNDTIVESVRQARRAGLDWRLFDMAGLLDSMAYRRYVEGGTVPPPWWKPYELPPELAELDPPPDTRFFRSGRRGRVEGGLFSLDGVHPTTIGYGILARGVAQVMEAAGVRFLRPADPDRPPIDFRYVLANDTLVKDPPASVTPTLSTLGWLDEKLDWVGRILP